MQVAVRQEAQRPVHPHSMPITGKSSLEAFIHRFHDPSQRCSTPMNEHIQGFPFNLATQGNGAEALFCPSLPILVQLPRPQRPVTYRASQGIP